MRFAATMTVLTAALALGACAKPELESLKAPDPATLFRPLSVTSMKERVLAPVTAEDLVDASGRCAGTFVPAEPGGDQAAAAQAVGAQAQAADTPTAGQPTVAVQQPGAPTIPAPIALEMTECDVVKRAGVADRVEIGANERGERSATLTFLQGARPGIYRFADGRLKSMERAPVPPAPPKPVRKKPAPKSKQAATR